MTLFWDGKFDPREKETGTFRFLEGLREYFPICSRMVLKFGPRPLLSFLILFYYKGYRNKKRHNHRNMSTLESGQGLEGQEKEVRLDCQRNHVALFSGLNFFCKILIKISHYKLKEPENYD